MTNTTTVRVLRVARDISLYLPVPSWIAAIVLFFSSSNPMDASVYFRSALIFILLGPVLFNAILLLALAIVDTSDSTAEADMVLTAAIFSVAPAAAVLPSDYWAVWVMVALFSVAYGVVRARLKFINPTGELENTYMQNRPVARQNQTKSEPAPATPASTSELTYEAERAEHTLDALAGMHEMKEALLAAAKEAKTIVRKDKNGDLRSNSRNGILLHGEPGNGKTVFAEGLAGSLNLPIIKMSFGSVSSKWVNDTTGNVVKLFKDARAQAPCVLFMDEVDSILLDRNQTQGSSEEGPKTTSQILTDLVATRGSGVVIVMATNFLNRLDSAAIREGRVDFKIEVTAPDADARRAIIEKTLSNPDKIRCEHAAIEQAVKRWEGFSAARIRAVVDEAIRQAKKAKSRTLSYKALQAALRTMQGGLGERLTESTPVLDHLHMPEAQKTALMGIAKRMLSIEEIERMGGSVPSGLLFAGPPGTGKTLAVRALAKTTDWPLLTRSGADLMADGKNIDELIMKAKNARPCIVFIDEADDVFSDRRAGSNYSASITNKLLTAMDGVGGKVHDILWIAAVNAPETMDSAALRGGRFTEKVWFENPDAVTVASIVAQWMSKSTAKFADDLAPSVIATWLEGVSPANIQAILQQSVNIMIGRSMDKKQDAIVSKSDIEHARIAILG